MTAAEPIDDSLPLPHGTDVVTRMNRVVRGEDVSSGTVGRVVGTHGARSTCRSSAWASFRYLRQEVTPFRSGQLRYALGAMSLRWPGLLAVLAGLSAACAEAHDAHADTAARSGSRLRLRWLESDGVRAVLGLHDAQLGVDCTVQKAGDGELYCFPGPLQPKQFVDAHCAELAAPTASCAPTPAVQATVSSSHGLLGATSACPFAELYTLQPPEPFASYFVQYSSSMCAEQPFLPPEPFMAQRLMARVPESALVHLSEVKTTGTDVVQNRYYAGDDGSYLPIGFFDARFGVCDPALAADGRTRCLPRADASPSPVTFADPACSIPVATTILGQLCDALEPKLVGSLEPNTNEGGCGSSVHRFFELGEPLTHGFGGSPCAELGPGNVLYNRVGPELDPATFALLDAVKIGSGRLRVEGWSAHGLEPIFALERSLVSFADAQLSLACSATTTSDGALRCVPTESGVAYSDATCTRPYAYSPHDCEPHAGPLFARLESDPCHVSVHAVARELEALGTTFVQSGAKCLQLGNGPASGYALQGVVDPALFAAMNERVE